jgi:ethanolamine utilization protein EutN
MQIGLVVGFATATVKHRSLQGRKLLLVQPLAPDGRPDAEPQLVIDTTGAGRGHRVIISSDGQATREMLGDETSPARYCVLGIQDA